MAADHGNSGPPPNRRSLLMSRLENILKQKVREGDLWERLDEKRIRCYACGHCCPVPEGRPRVCRVRFNRGGKLMVPWGYTGGWQCDPIEKKPFFHANTGALAYSFGMLGCDLLCAYCQNWETSQGVRDPAAVAPPRRATPQTLARAAVRQRARVIVSIYNEPLKTSEWAVAVFREARKEGLTTGFVSNGNGTPEVLVRLHLCGSTGHGPVPRTRGDEWEQETGFPVAFKQRAGLSGLHEFGSRKDDAQALRSGFSALRDRVVAEVNPPTRVSGEILEVGCSSHEFGGWAGFSTVQASIPTRRPVGSSARH